MVTITVAQRRPVLGIALGKDPGKRAELEALFAEVENARGGIAQ